MNGLRRSLPVGVGNIRFYSTHQADAAALPAHMKRQLEEEEETRSAGNLGSDIHDGISSVWMEAMVEDTLSQWRRRADMDRDRDMDGILLLLLFPFW